MTRRPGEAYDSAKMRPESERDFASWVTDLLTLRGWLWQHQRPARTAQGWRTAIEGTKGFPDIVAVRDRILFIELKSERGKLSVEQNAWIDALEDVTETSISHLPVIVYVWKPSDRALIERVLL